jgi:hypothetical protein
MVPSCSARRIEAIAFVVHAQVPARPRRFGAGKSWYRQNFGSASVSLRYDRLWLLRLSRHAGARHASAAQGANGCRL